MTKPPTNTAGNQVKFLCVILALENLKEKFPTTHFDNQPMQLIDLVREESGGPFYIFNINLYLYLTYNSVSVHLIRK